MKIPKDRIAWLGAEALRRIIGAPLPDQKRFLLGECVQAYLPMDDQQQSEFQRLVTGEAYAGVRAVNTTWYEKGIEMGMEKGMAEGEDRGRRAMLRDMLEHRFGPVSQAVAERLQQLSREQLLNLGKSIFQ